MSRDTAYARYCRDADYKALVDAVVEQGRALGLNGHELREVTCLAQERLRFEREQAALTARHEGRLAKLRVKHGRNAL